MKQEDNIEVSGMVISSMPIGEYDRRLEILTGKFGKISVFARGARKPSSALVSVSRPFACGTFSLYQGKSSYSLNCAKIVNYFEELAKDLELSCYGFYFLELARYFCREQVSAGSELTLLYQSLRALISKNFDNRLVRAVFELRLLTEEGYAPDAGYIEQKRNILSGTVYAYDFIQRSALSKLYTFRLSEEVLAELSDICSGLISTTADKEFNSLNLLETLTKVD